MMYTRNSLPVGVKKNNKQVIRGMGPIFNPNNPPTGARLVKPRTFEDLALTSQPLRYNNPNPNSLIEFMKKRKPITTNSIGGRRKPMAIYK